MLEPSRTIRTAIVTGGDRGIGAAIVERLSRDGLAVMIKYVHGREPPAAIGACGRALAVRADVADPSAMEALFDAAEHAFGGIDVLVNNAGVISLSPMVEATDHALDQLLAVNLKGASNGIREAGRRLRDGERVVSPSSSVVGLYQP